MIIRINKDSLRVELHGKEQVWALRAKVDLPRENIVSIRFEPVFQDWRKWEVRIPGTAVPRLLYAGSYWTEEGWDFLYLKRPRGILKPVAYDVLVIETNQNRYRRVIVSIDAVTARSVLDWWRDRSVRKTVEIKSTQKLPNRKVDH